ncbi:hypothetical protein F8388_018134 [Cannabis sativa]|uniref:Zinc knuckle CX2CX4HX4C domain-containing protein n=1 Tax=Cannabis sativa TaxID=3483 RepID=A0A7J6HN17_CANSA|nr:hypothetical protein G4B88_010087 [Cannabis sativa]KAF4395860.1 hypothetical protein F8388_018134 [Cannabis sativa]
MDHLLNDMNHTLILTDSEREVQTLPTAAHTGSPQQLNHVLYARVISSRDINQKTFRIKMSESPIVGTMAFPKSFNCLNSTYCFPICYTEGNFGVLRFRATLDISKPFLMGKMVKLKDSNDEFWLEFRYERLPEFFFKCGTIGHPFESYHKFLEQIYNGVEPSLAYGPSMIGSPLLESSYDRYRTDFIKGGVWPLMT